MIIKIISGMVQARVVEIAGVLETDICEVADHVLSVY